MRDVEIAVAPCSDFLAADYSCCFYTLGYEQRSTFAAQRRINQTGKRVAIGYYDCHLFSYDKNKEWYQSEGIEILECLRGDFRQCVSDVISGVLSCIQGPIRILVDISSMDRYRLATLVDLFRLKGGDAEINVDFVYCLAEYSPPPDLTALNRHVGPVTPQFAGWWTEPDKPTVTVVGVGYEQDKAVGAIEHVQPAEIWLFYPHSPVAEYTAALKKANASLVGVTKQGRILAYEVDRPYDLFAKLESLVAGLESRANCILLPFGPKIFALAALLVACIHEKSAVWRVSGGEQPVDRIGHLLYAMSVKFRCSEANPRSL
jgi:hypothetical protein